MKYIVLICMVMLTSSCSFKMMKRKNSPGVTRRTIPVPVPVERDDGKTIVLENPVKRGVIFRSFDKSANNSFEGLAIGAPENTPVVAAADGEVLFVGDDGNHFGRMVIIKNADPFTTVYGHLGRIDVDKNQMVKKGQIIGTVGVSGGVDSPRVFFQVRKNRTPVDPERYLQK